MSSGNVRVIAVTISSTPATLSPPRDVARLRCRLPRQTTVLCPQTSKINSIFIFRRPLLSTGSRLLKTKKTNKTITDHSIGDQARLCSRETDNCFFNKPRLSTRELQLTGPSTSWLPLGRLWPRAARQGSGGSSSGGGSGMAAGHGPAAWHG